MKINSVNKPKRRNITVMNTRTLRKNTPVRSKKFQEDMKVKTETYKIRSMNSKIILKKWKEDSKKKKKNI